jgi:hypothetical protein
VRTRARSFDDLELIPQANKEKKFKLRSKKGMKIIIKRVLHSSLQQNNLNNSLVQQKNKSEKKLKPLKLSKHPLAQSMRLRPYQNT